MSICSIHESKLGFEEWKTTFARSRFACLLDWGCSIVTGHVPKYEFSGRRNKLKHGLFKLVELDFPSFFVILFDTFSKLDHFYFSYSYPAQFEICQKIGKYLNKWKKNNSTWLYAHFWVYLLPFWSITISECFPNIRISECWWWKEKENVIWNSGRKSYLHFFFCSTAVVHIQNSQNSTPNSIFKKKCTMFVYFGI